MKPILKINFADFWFGFVKDNNYFYNVLSTRYQVVIDENPDFLFYSSYGREYLKYNCIRIYYTGENMRPDFFACDYAITFDFINRENHLRFPLYGYYIDMYPKQLDKDVSNLFVQRSRETLSKAWYAKKKFCCIVVSNGHAEKRIHFYKALDKYKKVDSGGRYLNNVGGPVADKLAFINDYRFVISFENESYPGYTTEKIMEPIMTDSIPIYWGNPKITEDFNGQRFLNYDSFENETALIEKIMELENDPEKAIDMIAQPPFPAGFEKPIYIQDERAMDFLEKIIQSKGSITPVAVTFKKYIHAAGNSMEDLSINYKKLIRKIKK